MDNSDELRDTILQALEGAAQACTALSGFILVAANNLRSGEIQEGNQLLVRVLDEFSQLTSFLQDVRCCKPFVEEGRQSSLDALDKESQEMADLLKMAVDAQEQEDWVYLADILEYEFSQKMGSWDGLLRGISHPGEARPSS
jgi:hypothetical protein